MMPDARPALLGIQAALILTAALLPASRALAIEPLPTDPAWTRYVAPLMTAEERSQFERLEQHFERQEFVERFWLARDPDPATPRNELREQWPQRIGVAEESFGGVDSDRGRAFMLAGPPTYMLTEICPDHLQAVEVWVYPSTSAAATEEDANFVFFRPEEDGELVFWRPGVHTVADLVRQATPNPRQAGRLLERECHRGGELTAILAQAQSPERLRAPVAAEWLDAYRSEVIGLEGKHLECALDFSFPAHIRNQTVVHGLLSVRPPVDSPGDKLEVIVDGDVFRGERRADHFRYRFETAGSQARRTLGFRRHLAPGTYRVLLTARHPATGSIFHTEQQLQVPSVGPLPGEDDSSGPSPVDVGLTIQPLPLGLLTGRQRVDVVTSGEGVAEVVFLLDGRRVMMKSRPPFSVELDFGSRPRTHTLEVVGHDQSGREIGRDLVPVNAGPHRFAVRLVEPRQGYSYPAALTVHADVNVPTGDKLDRVELFFNEDRVATLYQPPFVHPNLELPSRYASGYVRAVAILDDGNSADDLVVINTGSTVDQLQVDFVELYASALDRKGSPVTGLDRDDFTVLEDGVEQAIRRFESVDDLPINAGIVLDTSISMLEELQEAEDAALRFFENVIQPKDRAAVVVFSDQPELRVPLTNSHSRLAAGLDGIEAGGETTLYDSVVFGLYYLVGLRGKRALILLTDGLDSRSRYSFADTLDFARFSGVAIYPIGIDIPRGNHEAQRVLRQLANETGGDCYFIDTARELERIYAKIESELRSQYLIGYQSTQSGSDDFRRIEIRTSRPGLEVKAIPGYYP